eukprot:1016669-Pleurochrysis_carterae.AAC.2
MSSTLAINSDQLKSLCSVPGTFYPAKSPGEDLTDAQESFIRLFRAVIAEPYSESQVSIEAQATARFEAEKLQQHSALVYGIC